MDVTYWIFILIGGAVGTLILYYIILAAVKNGILDANKIIETEKLEKRLAELKEKDPTGNSLNNGK